MLAGAARSRPGADRRTPELLEIEAGQLERTAATLAGEAGASESSTTAHAHAPMLPFHRTTYVLAVSGVAAVAMKPNLPFVHPSSLAARLRRMLAEAGDVDPLGDA